MPASTWNAHYASLKRSVSTLKASQEFKALAPLLPRPFADAVALIEHLDGRSLDLDETDAIYRVLVRAAQQGSPFATAALWLGLWPGLDCIYRRWFSRFVDGPVVKDQELVSELGAAFTYALHSANLDDINRLVATLVANSERRIAHQRKRADERAGREEEVPEDTSRDAPRQEPPAASELGMQRALADEDGAAQVHRLLREHLPERDAKLIFATVVEGETQKDFADRLGASPEAVRKRHQRALKSLASLSHFADPQRVYRMRGNKPPPRRARR